MEIWSSVYYYSWYFPLLVWLRKLVQSANTRAFLVEHVKIHKTVTTRIEKDGGESVARRKWFYEVGWFCVVT